MTVVKPFCLGARKEYIIQRSSLYLLGTRQFFPNAQQPAVLLPEQKARRLHGPKYPRANPTVKRNTPQRRILLLAEDVSTICHSS